MCTNYYDVIKHIKYISHNSHPMRSARWVANNTDEESTGRKAIIIRGRWLPYHCLREWYTPFRITALFTQNTAKLRWTQTNLPRIQTVRAVWVRLAAPVPPHPQPANISNKTTARLPSSSVTKAHCSIQHTSAFSNIILTEVTLNYRKITFITDMPPYIQENQLLRYIRLA
jgi:hypothetical protein